MPNSPFRVSTEMDITSSRQVGWLCSQLLVITTRMIKPFCELEGVMPFCSLFLVIYPLEKNFLLLQAQTSEVSYQSSCSLGGVGAISSYLATVFL